MAENCMKVRIADGADCKPALRVEVANMKGVWPALVAGSAQSLVGPKVSAGPAVALAAPATGAAILDTIKGSTVKWNETMRSVSFGTSTESGVTYTKVDNYTWNINGTATADNTKSFFSGADMVIGHKYLTALDKSVSGIVARLGSTDLGAFPQIFTCANNVANVMFKHADGAVFNNVTVKPQVIDLTDYFGAGNEPSTVAEALALFPDFPYAYNPGTILPYKGEGIKVTGANQWDERWELGDISSGSPVPNTNHWRSKNFCRCLPSRYYYVKTPIQVFIFYYDKKRRYLGSYEQINVSKLITIPAGAFYFKINDRTRNTYANDICINLSAPSINGQYFPYIEPYTLSLPIVGKTAKDSGGNPIVPFPEGMHGTPTVYDTATKEGGEVKWGFRDYEAGDESDATVITDGTNTAYPLDTPVPFTWDEPLEMVAPVAEGGVLFLQPEGVDEQGIPATAPLAADIKWPFSVSSIDGTLANLLDALKTAGVISAYTMTYNAATGKYDSTIN